MSERKSAKRYLLARTILLWVSAASSLLVARNVMAVTMKPAVELGRRAVIGDAVYDAVLLIILTSLAVVVFTAFLLWFIVEWILLKRSSKKMPALYLDNSPQTLLFMSIGYGALVLMLGVLLLSIVVSVQYVALHT